MANDTDTERQVLPGPELLSKMAALGQAFRPAAPINTRDLFAGRTAQVSDIFGVTAQPGQHAVIYGERGVGKTSLATVTTELISTLHGATRRPFTARANCDTGDDYSSIWRKAFEQIQFLVQTPGFGFGSELQEAVETAGQYLPSENITPDDVRRVMQILSVHGPVVVFVDEFDRLPTNGAQTLFADTIKTLSDQMIDATIVVVGVADDVSELIAEHHSVERALVQIHMPRMSPAELAEIVNRGMETAEMTIADEATDRITRLSQGLPHYTHLLAQLAGNAALDEGRQNVILDDVETAIARAISRAQQSIMDAYHRATFSTRTTLYPQVLLACALADGDEFGFFAAPDVRDPLTRIMGKPYDIPAFAQHLNELSEAKRGPILQKKGQVRRFRYRFVNPLVQPYVVMKGLSDELIDVSALS
jgi:Cdc6-like AAA superfamily ATPase